MLRTFSAIPAPRNPLSAFGAFVVVVVAAYYAAEAVIYDDIISLAYVALLFAAGALAVVILNDWRRGLYFFVGWLVFEDFARKYLGNNMAIYFGKDFLVLILYLSFFRAKRLNRGEKFKIPFRVPLLLFIWLGILQMFNPSSTSIFYGILGIKVNFLYVPLIYVGYFLVEKEQELQRFLSFVCILVLAVAGLGLAQSIIGPSFLNPAHLQEDIRELSTLYRTSPISGAVAYRPTSVFVSASRFGDFLVVNWMFSLGYGGYLLLRTRRGRALAFLTIGVVAIATLMTASRGPFMWNAGAALVFIIGFTWGAPWRQREAIRVLRTIVRMTAFVFVAVWLLVVFYPKDLGSRISIYSETLMPDSPTSELSHRTQAYPQKQLGYAFDYPQWPYGYGTGTCTLGTQYVIKLMHAEPMRIGVESGFGNLILELGILGFVLWLILGTSIAFSCWKVIKELRGTPWFPLAFGISLYAVLLFFPMMFAGLSPYQDYVLNASLWIYLGILFRLRSYPQAIALVQNQMPEREA